MTNTPPDVFLTTTRVPGHPSEYEYEVEALVRAKSQNSLGRRGPHSKFSTFLIETLEFNRKSVANQRPEVVRSPREVALDCSTDSFQEKLLRHRHQKMREKLTVDAEPNYYTDLPIKPGFLFLDCLMKAPRSRISDLHINIPESLYCSDKMYYLATDHTGRVVCSTEINPYKYMELLERHRIIGKESELSLMDRIATVYRAPDEQPQDMQKHVMDWKHFKVKMIGSDKFSWCLIQQFIKPSGGRPSITRLHYFPFKNDNKANFAYFINSLALEKSQSIQRCVVDVEQPKFLEIFKVSGGALRTCEVEAQKIVAYLNKGYNIRIEEIVLDFLRDEKENIWLCGCKGFKIDPSTLPVALFPLENWWPDYNPEDQPPKAETKSRKNFSSCVHCKLCRLHYPNKELTNLISVRMYIMYQRHVSRRKDLPWEFANTKVVTNGMLSQSVRVCSYCYMLVISEFELIKAEAKLAKALNVPLKEIDYESAANPEVLVQFLPKKLVQWRVLMIGMQLFDFGPLGHPESLHFHFKFANMVTSFQVHWQVRHIGHEPCISLDFVRTHYFFSNAASGIKTFLKSFDIEVILSNSARHTQNVLARGKGNLLRDFPSNLPSAICETKQLVLFNDWNKPMASLKLVVGLSRDHEVPRDKITTVVEKVNEVYLADNHYMTSDPLPVEWMELFGAKISRNKSFGPYLDDEKFYTPTITKAEMRKMEEVGPLSERRQQSARLMLEQALSARCPENVINPTNALQPKKVKPKIKPVASHPVLPRPPRKDSATSKPSKASTHIDSLATITPKSASRKKKEKQLFIINQYASSKMLRPQTAATTRIRRIPLKPGSVPDINEFD